MVTRIRCDGGSRDDILPAAGYFLRILTSITVVSRQTNAPVCRPAPLSTSDQAAIPLLVVKAKAPSRGQDHSIRIICFRLFGFHSLEIEKDRIEGSMSNVSGLSVDQLPDDELAVPID